MPGVVHGDEGVDSPVHVDHLRVGYGRARRPVIADLSWVVPRGRIGLLGPNGAGKSTLIKALTGELRSIQGSVSFARSDAVVGYVPQSSSLPGHLGVRHAVEYVAWMNGLPQDRLGVCALEALRRVALSEKADSRVKHLSGGQRQRLFLACGIVRDPAVLILDEPTAGLDPSQRLNIRKAVAELNPDCLILATHLLEDVDYLCDHVAVMVEGAIRWTGPLSAFKAELNGHARESTYGSQLEVAYESFIQSFQSRDVSR